MKPWHIVEVCDKCGKVFIVTNVETSDLASCCGDLMVKDIAPEGYLYIWNEEPL